MIEVTALIITTLATYGFSSLITTYDGLWGVFAKLRQKYPHSAFTCTVCLSLWVAVPFIALAWLGFSWVLLPFAIVSIVMLLERI